ncbi:MAG: DUF456 domain-containing protein [Bacteroidota bacterium]
MSHDTLYFLLAVILAVVGLLGSFLPLLPGTPLSAAALLLLYFSVDEAPSTITTGAYVATALVIMFLDYYIPVIGSKFFGGSKYGTRGATFGMVIGLFLGPLGMILGPFIGAYIGEMKVQNNRSYAMKAALGSFVGFLAGTVIKVGYALLVLAEVFKYR